MALELTSLSQLRTLDFDEIIDVRSPAEYAEDHLPGAVNLPVLDNEERARVGTIYTRESPFKARKIGAAIVARNAARHLEGPLADRPGGWRPLVYCWRGGQRSGSFASILAQVGWRTEVLAGGYRTYRRLVAAAMHDAPLPHRLVLIDGNTGTAKTDILKRAGEIGVQTVDLEGLARHRGSLFGAMAEPQPSQRAFEAALALAFDALDPSRPVLVEAESSKVGNVQVPPSVWKAMRAAPRIRITASLDARAAYLTRAYADIVDDAGRLAGVVQALRRFQPRERIEHWQELSRSGAFEALARELMEFHYDPRYGKWRDRSEVPLLGEIGVERFDDASIGAAAEQIAKILGDMPFRR